MFNLLLRHLSLCEYRYLFTEILQIFPDFDLLSLMNFDHLLNIAQFE